MSLSMNHLYFQQILPLSYSLVYAKWCLSGFLQVQNRVWFNFASCPSQSCELSVLFSYMLCSHLLGSFTKSSLFLFYCEEQSERFNKSQCQEISPHLIKSSVTPNRIATVSYTLFLICLGNTFSDDTR